jgi:signal transduction histidine kinase
MRGNSGQPESTPAGQAAVNYGLAVGCVAAGVLVALLLRSVLDASVVLLVAVLLAAWFSSLWPALVASVLATLALDYFFTAPFYTLKLDFAHIPRLTIFTLFSAFVASASAARRRAERLLQHARDQLEIRVHERTAALRHSNEQLQAEIIERRRTEAELEDVAGRLIHAQEQERSRIGRELHDHISQMLGILAIEIDQLRAESSSAPPAVAAALDHLRARASEITDDVHRLSHRLHSSTLDYLGLAPALQKLVGEFAQRHDIAITLSNDGLPAALPSQVALCLFRVVEEGLSNIAKHSQARSANVRVTGQADGIHLAIEDDGRGFDATAGPKKVGLGLVSMQERLRVLRGTVGIDSVPSRGTRIHVWIPAASLGEDTIAADHEPASIAESQPRASSR